MRMKVKKSKFTRKVQLNADMWLVHNLISGSECILDEDEIGELENISNIDYDVFPETIQKLYDMGIIVNDEVNENACLELERRISISSFTTDEVGFVIAPTMNCNASCFYCYENQTRSSCYMNQDTTEALIKYIKRTSLGKKRLFISWFGGEPLMCKDLIRYISKELIRFCDENNIEYHSELTTNGYYLDDFISELTVLSIKDTQITIDGYDTEYLKRKNYINCDNAWERVVNNIFSASILGNHITLRMNFDRYNIESIKIATERFIADKRWNSQIAIYYYPLEGNSERYFKESEYEEIMTDLYKHLYSCGYYQDRSYALDFHKLSLPCYGATLGIVAVDYMGKIYQCQHLLCQNEYAIGDVFSGIIITKDIINWYDGKIRSECEYCEVLPLCQGGCVTKPKINQSDHSCHMMKYRIKVQEELKAIQYKEKYDF